MVILKEFLVKNRILIISSEFPPLPGGIGNHAYNLGENLSKRNYMVNVLTDHRDVLKDKSFDSVLNFKVYRTKRYKLILWSYIKRFLMAFSLVKSNDTIILSGKFSLWLGGVLSLFFNRKFIGVVHGSELNLNNKNARDFTKHCLKRFDRIIAVSSYTKSFLPSIDTPVIIINNGFNIYSEKRKQYSHVKRKEISLITVGNLTQRKGQHNLIRAIPLLKKHFSKVTYHIVGIPTDQLRIEALAQNLELLDSIQIHGMVTEVRKTELLLDSDIFVMLSEEIKSGDIEGFGIAILEGNHLGIPAIGAKGTGVEDAISENYSGFLVNSRDEKEVTQAILKIMEHHEAFSQQSILWAEKFSWSNIVEQYIKVIEF